MVSVFDFDTEEEAIELANDSCFSLAAYAATRGLGRAQGLGQELNAGMTIITATASPSGGGVSVGFEGHRESGFGF